MKTQSKSKVSQESVTPAMIKTRQVLETILPDKNLDFGHYSIDGFCTWLEKKIGRQFMLIPKEEVWAGMSGLWLSGEDQPVEFIFYTNRASPSPQVHIRLHELAHILLGHIPTKVSTKTAVFFAINPILGGFMLLASGLVGRARGWLGAQTLAQVFIGLSVAVLCVEAAFRYLL